MKTEIAPTQLARRPAAWPQSVVFVSVLLSSLGVQAEFSLNFQPNPNVVSSWANVSCEGGGMGGGGCSTPFLQELVDDNGTQYYHVIVGDVNSDFVLEFYIRNGGCCWWSGGMGGGGTPYSSSGGDAGNANEPLAAPSISGNGTGNPTRVYMRQIIQDGQVRQEFLKTQEAIKPRITQTIDNSASRLAFELDMSNGDYASFSTPAQFVNTMTLGLTDGSGDFDMATDASQSNITAGQFTYTAGGGHGGSAGGYSYIDGGFDVYGIDWLSYCDPSQNPDHLCEFSANGGMGR